MLAIAESAASVELSYANTTETYLPYLAVLPGLRSLVMQCDSVTFTSASLGQLACLESLAELEIFNERISAVDLDSLRALKRLRRLHLWGGWGSKVELAALALDGNDKVQVLETELEGCRRAWRR